MKRVSFLCIVVLVCHVSLAFGQAPPHADITIVGPDAPVVPVPGGEVAFVVQLDNTVSALNGMGLYGVVTPENGGAAEDMWFDRGELHSDLGSFIDGIGGNTINTGASGGLGYALFASDPQNEVPDYTGPLGVLYYKYDAAAVEGNTYNLDLDDTMETLGGGITGSKSFVSVGNGFDATFVPSEFWMGGTKIADTGTAVFTGDDVTFVPEPATLALLGAGIAGLAGLRRRRK